jgi:hypothetical protein
LIALAPIVAPVMASFFGLQGTAIFWVGIAFILASLLPLAVARSPVAHHEAQATAQLTGVPQKSTRDRIFMQGMVIALLGGMMDAAVSGLFAPYAQGHAISVSQTADLLAVFGLGGLLLQYGQYCAGDPGLDTAAQSRRAGCFGFFAGWFHHRVFDPGLDCQHHDTHWQYGEER